MKLATEYLIRHTYLSEIRMFAEHDDLVPLDWEKIWGWVEVTKLEENEKIILDFLAFLDGQVDFQIGNATDFSLSDDEKRAILEALRIDWLGLELQENL